MTPRQWERHEANIGILTDRMDKIISSLSDLIVLVRELPNISQEILDVVDVIHEDTSELHGIFNAK